MDPFRALFDLFRLGARFGELRGFFSRTARKAMAAVTLLSLAIVIGAAAVILLIIAADQALEIKLGPIYSPLILGLGMLLVAGVSYMIAHRTAFQRKLPPVTPTPAKPDEMSTSALLALLGGIVVGTVLNSHKKEHTKV